MVINRVYNNSSFFFFFFYCLELIKPNILYIYQSERGNENYKRKKEREKEIIDLSPQCG